MNCPSMGPFHGVQSFTNSLLQHGSPTGSQVLPAYLLQRGLVSLHGSTGPDRSLFQRGLPTGSQLPSGTHLVRCGVFHGGQVEICSTVDLLSLQGDSLPWSSSRAAGEKSLLWHLSTSSPSFFTALGVCRVVSFTLSQSSLSTAISLQVFPLLRYVITEALPPMLIGLVLASSGSVLEPAGIGSIRYGESFSQLLTEATPVAPPTTKTLPRKPTTGRKIREDFLTPWAVFGTLALHCLKVTMVHYASYILVISQIWLLPQAFRSSPPLYNCKLIAGLCSCTTSTTW